MAGMLTLMIPGEKSGKDFLLALGQLLLVCGSWFFTSFLHSFLKEAILINRMCH